MKEENEKDSDLPRPLPHAYKAAKLGSHGLSWAVIEEPSGAIALDAEENLILRLTQKEAVALAAEMTQRISGSVH